MKLKAESEVFAVKYNSDGNFCMSGHSDRTVKVRLFSVIISYGMQIKEV